MNAVERVLRDFIDAAPTGIGFALVGGVAVSARTEPRFTRDLDFVVAVADDPEAEAYVHGMRALGYEPRMLVEHEGRARLSTVRLKRAGRGPLVDLLFSSSGIEAEIVADAELLEISTGLATPVARVGHLIALKLLARDDLERPQDLLDLRALTRVADDEEWARAATAVAAITERGYARGRDLVAALAAWRSGSA